MSVSKYICLVTVRLLIVALLHPSVGSASSIVSEYFVTIQPASVGESLSVTHVIITSATNKFALLAMPGYRVNNHPAESQVIFTKTDGTATMSVTLLGFPSAKADPWQKVIADRFPDGTIVQEAVATVAGRTGPMFDVAWQTPQGLKGKSRIAFIPSSFGTLEFALTTPAEKFATARYDFHNLLLTARTAVNGQLDLSLHYGAAD